MNIHIRKPNLSLNYINGQQVLTITAEIDEDSREEVLSNAEYIVGSREMFMELERSYPQRSKNANAMFWALCEKLATAMGTSNDEMYLMLLERYGTANVVTADADMADSLEPILKEKYKWIKRLGNMMINGRESVQFFCYRGTHTYNTAEMTRLINGTLDDCRELGIPTDSRRDIEQAISEWGN